MTYLKTFILRLFQFEGTKMHSNVLLMCKLLLLLLIAHHMFFKISDPFIPFIPGLDMFNTYPNVFNYSLKIIFGLSAFALLFNIKVRTASLINGCVIILSILASKPLFFNHNFICACALILAGLSNDKDPPYLFVLQLSLVYFGASINKFLEPDWWSGAFMDNWLGTARENPPYLYMSQLFPKMILAKLLSYIAMFTEFSIAIFILFKKTRRLTVWFIIVFHTTLFTLTSFRFGHFLESLVITLLAFNSITKAQLNIVYRQKSANVLKQFFRVLDMDKKQTWAPNNEGQHFWLQLKHKDQVLFNHKALKFVLLNTPNFFMLLFAIDVILYILLYNHRTTLFVLNAIFVWIMIVYFLPINWSKLFKKTPTYKLQ
ncbi:HTTM domain-containing protein [uncultured Psychroserpens sp.]|uniref:HTTM domain-containing protein n=1 Tax=uncultured Psychroserpens sp. TaxID=255436 RepID=UPI0026369760|nr:HTTM domain-containing protein [uncultured Psychroserpens sp.]